MRIVFVFLAAFMLVGCANQPTKSDAQVVDLYPNFKRHMDGCSEKHGFDPTKTEAVGEYELAPGETAWRECVYLGVEQYILPNTPVPTAYFRIVEEDRVMTDQISRGELSRAERRARLEELIELAVTEERQTMDAQLQQAMAMQDLYRRQEMIRQVDYANRNAMDAARAVRAMKVR